jgi:hypothetical protein
MILAEMRPSAIPRPDRSNVVGSSRNRNSRRRLITQLRSVAAALVAAGRKLLLKKFGSFAEFIRPREARRREVDGIEGPEENCFPP